MPAEAFVMYRTITYDRIQPMKMKQVITATHNALLID